MKRTPLPIALAPFASVALSALLACGSKSPPAAATGAPSAQAPAATTPVAESPASTPATAPVPSPDPAVAVADAGASPPSPPADDSPNDAEGVAYLESVQVLYKQQRPALTTACWLHATSSERAYAGKALIRVAPGGKLISVKTEGTDESTSACVDKQIKKWKMPPPNGTATVTLPVRLHRD